MSDVRHVHPADDRDAHVSQQVSYAPGVTHRLLPVTESPTAAVQFAGGPPPPPPLQLRHVPLSSAPAPVDVLADAFGGPSNGSFGGDGGGYGGVEPLPAAAAAPTRRTREFIPESKKDDEYWMKRQKNNEAAKRSREKRRANDTVMLRRIHELAAENKRLKVELDVLRRQLGIAATSAESLLPPPAAVAHESVAQLPATEDQLMSRSALEVPPASSAVRYDDAVESSCSYRSCVATVQPARGEQNSLREETNLHQLHHPAYRANWPTTTCTAGGGSSSLSASPVDARSLAYRRSISGNLLPSIGDLCGSAARQNPSPWSSYRSMTDGERTGTCRDPAPPPPRAVDSAPIVIFSDVSSSSSDSVGEEAFYARHPDTLTLRQPVQQVPAPGGGGVAESPLNLSTPTRCQSPVRAYAAARRSSAEFSPLAVHWLPVKTEQKSSRDPAAAGWLSEGALSVGCSGAPGVVEWPPEASNGSPADDAQRGCLSSRSTSLSSVASAPPWQGDVAAAPQQRNDTVAASERPLPAGAQPVRCGLPLKVRRKLGGGGGASTCRATVDDAPRPPCDDCAAAGSRAWSREDRGPVPQGPTLSPPQWLQTAAEHGRLAGMPDLDVLDPSRDDR